MNESTLGVHKIELMIETSPGFGNGGGVAQHAHRPLHLGKVTARNNGRGLVVDADLETSWTPVDELQLYEIPIRLIIRTKIAIIKNETRRLTPYLNGSLCLDGCYGSVDVLGNDVTTIQHAAGHVLAMTWIALHHLIGRFKASVGDFSH